MKLKFYKEKTNRWYVDLPEFEGLKEELEMVGGADTMLDIISEGDNLVYLDLKLNKIKGYGLLRFVSSTSIEEGSVYFLKNYSNIEYNLNIWLCSVTLFVFGCYPEKIYFKKITL